MSKQDQDIIMRLKQGDEQAYRYLFHQHYNVLCCYANELLNDSFMAESIVGDTIFHFWEIRERVDVKSTLRAYLMRAVKNRCLNYKQLEREKREIRFSTMFKANFADDLSDEQQPLGRLIECELENQIIDAVENLPEECKQVFKKSRFENKKNDEIAEELGISVNTVKYHIKSAIVKLHSALEQYLAIFILAIILFSS